MCSLLVFQRDVEAITSQLPQVLLQLNDQISGLLHLKVEYVKCKEVMQRATENFRKRRSIAGEITYKEQKGEAEKFEGLAQEKVHLTHVSQRTQLTLLQYQYKHRMN
jgi:chromosome segregation ATPase